MIVIYTDGSSGRNGSGGWAFVAYYDGTVHKELGAEKQTTNNRMEMTAAIKALKYCQQFHPKRQVKIISDSQYLVKGFNDWSRRPNWLSDSSKMNLDLWHELANFHQYNVIFEWVKGHNGHAQNEFVDKLAGRARRFKS